MTPALHARARTRWAALGITALVGSYVLVMPTFSSTPSPPQPWGLWVSTNTQSSASEYERPKLEPDWLLTLRIKAPAGCTGPVTATGALQWVPKFLTDRIKPPTRLLLGIAGARVLRAEVRNPESIEARHPEAHTWHSVRLVRIEDTYIAESAVAHWNIPDQPAEFRLVLMAAHTAGFGSCYLTSPAIATPKEGMREEVWTDVGINMQAYVEEHHLEEFLGGALALDAVVQMSVSRQEPDRAALDAGAHVQRGNAILTCTTHERESASEADEDQFYNYLKHVDERFCASIQTFRASSASASLNKRFFFSGILVAAAAGMLFRALASRRRDAESDA